MHPARPSLSCSDIAIVGAGDAVASTASPSVLKTANVTGAHSQTGTKRGLVCERRETLEMSRAPAVGNFDYDHTKAIRRRGSVAWQKMSWATDTDDEERLNM